MIQPGMVVYACKPAIEWLRQEEFEFIDTLGYIEFISKFFLKDLKIMLKRIHED
jgi:hypothetical protein